MGIRHAAIVVVTLLLLLHVTSCVLADGPIAAIFPSHSGPVPDSSNCSARNMKALNHLAVDRSTGRIYVGGVNRLVQLDAALRLEQCQFTGPKNDSAQCHASGCAADDVETTLQLQDNVNKVLLLDTESGVVIACGSLSQGACERYALGNVSAAPQFVAIGIAANDEHSSTYAFIGPEHYNQWGQSNVLYVGTTFTNNGAYREDVPAVSSRRLDTLHLAEDTFSKQSLLRIDVKYRDHFLVEYVYGFNYSDYAYFVLVQKQSPLPGQEELGYVTRLARVCVSDANYDSYAEVTLQCLVKEEASNGKPKVVNYNLAQDAKLAAAGEELAASLDVRAGDAVLAAAFSPSRGITNEPQPQSALCVYSMKEVEEKFNENIHMCFNGSVKYRNMAYISGLILNGDCPSAGTTGNIYNFCEVGLRISGFVPITTQAAIYITNKLVTSVTITVTEKSTVALLGTSDGVMKKVLLDSFLDGIEYEELTLDSGNAILPDTTVSPIGGYIYVLTTSKVMKVSIEHCVSYSNCSSCLEARDPYCGWCSLEKRCTVRSACQQASQSLPRWLSYGAGQQCIDFEQVLPDRIPINQITTVHLTIRTLPELPAGAKYRCVFGGAEPIDAGVTPFGLTCPTPSMSYRPKISEGQDHVYVPLSVRSSETNKDFVSRNFAYFDCGSHKKCSDCVKSNWACNWCIYQNECIHNATECHGGVTISGERNPIKLQLHGRNSCPRFRVPSEPILIPNGVSKSIVIEVENMPQPKPGNTGFKCIISVEDARMKIPAKVEEGRLIVCEKTLYSYRANKGEIEASVTIEWNRGHHVDTINVTLYKCEILGSHREHADCSLCITRNSKYHCSWCNNACSYQESCPMAFSSECPKPRIDVIKPLSGPVEGGTLITIEGSNLGLKEDDVRNKIQIDGSPCSLVEYEVSVRIVCRTGFSKIKKSAPIIIGNAAGFTESSVHFSYESVILSAVTPQVGPLSGGTQLAITGSHLNIGSHTTAYLDELPCHINSTQATSSRITCITSKVAMPRTVRTLTLIIDGANRTLTGQPFKYKPDPVIAEIKPLMSFVSGGRVITVHGTNFDTIQNPEMVVFMNSEFHYPVNKTDCIILSSTRMECPSPSVNFQFLKLSAESSASRRRRKRSIASKSNDVHHLMLKIGFIMDNVESVKDLEKHYKDLPSTIVYVEDPKFYRFPSEEKLYKGDTLVIEGENLNAASDEFDVRVTIGAVPCNITSLASTQLVCIPPQVQPSATDEMGKGTALNLPLVVVHVGTRLRYPIGYIRYDMVSNYNFPTEAVAGIIAGIVSVLILFIIGLTFFRRKSTQAEREYKRIQIQMDTLESNVRLECKQAFAELQTDMTDLTADLESSGIPTLDHNEYILKVFFPGVRDHPILSDPKMRMNCPPTNYDAAMLQFEQLINNKYFLLTFIETLESQKSFDLRDRVNVASLLMIVLMSKMEYATDILKCLLLRLIDKSVASRHPQLMLRRTESVVEKMLTNWLALCMYSYLKDYAGSSLFLLYKAIKHQVEKGPVDAVTHEARYSLSEDRLLREQIEHNVVTLHVLQDDVDEKIQCKVLDCDTISQVKSKILDALYKTTPFSMRPSMHDVDLEWRHGRGGHLTLRDEDVTSKTLCGWRKLNTLAHYGIRESAVMSLIPRTPENYAPNCKQPCQNYNFGFPTVTSVYFTNSLSPIITTSNGGLENVSVNYYHLVKPVDEHQYFASKISERMHKAIPEIYLTRLLSTKGTIQKFVDDFFTTILTANEALPPAVKWLFDLFDEASRRHNIVDPEVLHAWKSNSLPLRFWVNFIKNPDFIFDINKTPTVDSCLSVIAQTFIDSCSMTDHRLGKDSPSNKLLFAKDIPHYRDIVARFYCNIQLMPPVSDQELSSAMQQLSASQFGHFSSISALKELYIYVSKYHDEILESLDLDPYCKGTHLSHKLENVACTLEGEETSAC